MFLSLGFKAISAAAVFLLMALQGAVDRSSPFFVSLVVNFFYPRAGLSSRQVPSFFKGRYKASVWISDLYPVSRA